jgi:hypothetical protein
MNNAAEIDDFVTASFREAINEFRPCAFFDDRLDCIRVIARDCSTREDRISDSLNGVSGQLLNRR